jgi:hypothetical protein
MILRILTVLLCLILGASAQDFHQTIIVNVTGSGDFTFTPLHTYFISSTSCNDANAGTSTAAPWCTPNHNVVCGDVILVNPGTYNVNFGWPFGTVSSCPSSSGGIDGVGGVYFAVLLCAGSDLEACKMNSSQSGQELINMNNNYWAMEGFKCDGTNNFCFTSDSGANNRIIHHNAFINNISFNAAQGFATNGCPGGCTHNIPGEGSDYVAIVGNIAQNSNRAGICLAAIDIVGPGVFDNLAGTHHYLYGNFAFNNVVNCSTDGEALMFDTWDAHGAAYQGVIANNIAWTTERYNLQGFYQWANTGASTWLFHHNTLYSSCHGFYTENTCAGLNITPNSNYTINVPYTVIIQNNISLETLATQAGNVTGGPVYALALGGLWQTLTVGGTGNENILKGTRTTCQNQSGATLTCDPGNNAVTFQGASLGTNFYVDPIFNNTTDLMSNRSGTPNCTGFENATQCMGYDARTSTLTTPSVISDLAAGCAQCSGKGYQLPSTTCAANPEYPAYLKGVVYLHASGWTNGATITEKAGLVTKPCSM